MSSRPIVHIEIPAADPQTLGDFYKTVFGWGLNLDPTFNYLQFTGEGGPGGAFVQNSGDFWAGAGANSPLLYIGTDDIDGDISKVQGAGCQVLTPKMEIPNIGWMAIFRDPSGNHVGLYATLHAPS